MERKKIILFLLLGVFALALIYRILNPYKQPRVERLKFSPGARSAAEKPSEGKKISETTTEEGLDHFMKVFLNRPQTVATVIKNPFFDDVKKKLQNEKPAQVPKQQPVVKPSTRESLREKVMKELSEFKVFGAYETRSEMALFIQRGKDILIVRPGDRIYGKYRVKNISKDSITITAEEIGEDVHIAFDDF